MRKLCQVKKDEMGWAGHVALIGEKRDAYSVFITKSEQKIKL
jgi:hypothetical protein